MPYLFSCIKEVVSADTVEGFVGSHLKKGERLMSTVILLLNLVLSPSPQSRLAYVIKMPPCWVYSEEEINQRERDLSFWQEWCEWDDCEVV